MSESSERSSGYITSRYASVELSESCLSFLISTGVVVAGVVVVVTVVCVLLQDPPPPHMMSLFMEASMGGMSAPPHHSEPQVPSSLGGDEVASMPSKSDRISLMAEGGEADGDSKISGIEATRSSRSCSVGGECGGVGSAPGGCRAPIPPPPMSRYEANCCSLAGEWVGRTRVRSLSNSNFSNLIHRSSGCASGEGASHDSGTSSGQDRAILVL